MDYASPDGYKQCVERGVRRKMIKLLGCIPPWMTQLDNEPICYDDIIFKDEEHAKEAPHDWMSAVVEVGSDDEFPIEAEAKHLVNIDTSRLLNSE